MAQESETSDEDLQLPSVPAAPPRGWGGTSAGALTVLAPAAAPPVKGARPPSFAAYSAAQKSLQRDALRLVALAAFPLQGVLQVLASQAWIPALGIAAQVCRGGGRHSLWGCAGACRTLPTRDLSNCS